MIQHYWYFTDKQEGGRVYKCCHHQDQTRRSIREMI